MEANKLEGTRTHGLTPGNIGGLTLKFIARDVQECLTRSQVPTKKKIVSFLFSRSFHKLSKNVSLRFRENTDQFFYMSACSILLQRNVKFSIVFFSYLKSFIIALLTAVEKDLHKKATGSCIALLRECLCFLN